MIQAHHYTSEAEMRAAYIARRNRLRNPKLKPANANKPEAETVVKVVITSAAPEWMRRDITFSAHVRAFYAFNGEVGKSPIRKFIAFRALDLDTTFSKVMLKTRKKDTVLIRHIIMYEIKTIVAPSMSYPEIGRLFDQDHTSVMHAVRRIQNLVDRGEVQTIKALPA